jgi:hypothetical protein
MYAIMTLEIVTFDTPTNVVDLSQML